MTNPFQIVAERLGELGFYNFFLPWVITSAVIWGLLKKSEVFGKNAVVINSVLSIGISFFIWGSILIGGGPDVGLSLSKFFTQMSLIAIGFAVMLVIGSIFFPDFPAKLKDSIPTEGLFWMIIVIGFIILIGAGVLNIGSMIYNLLSNILSVPGGDVGILIVAVVVLVLLLMFIGFMGGG